jgi:parallel beta-helix repeat protein
MKRFIILPFIIILLLNTINLVTSQKIENNLPLSYKNIIYVDDDNIYGPWDGTSKHPYKTINDGIINATEKDTIYVFNGTYNENVIINKRLALEGENKTSTIIDGLYQEYVILVTKDNVNIKNFTIRNSGGYKANAGIKLESNNNIITECKIYRTKTGIHIRNCNNNQINSCLFYTNGEGIYIKSSSKCKVEESCLYHNAFGLNIQDSSDIEINNCYEHTSGFGFLINHSSNINISTCAVYDNNDNGAGLFITNCENIDVFNCNIIHNGHSLNFYNSSNNLVLNSDFIWNTHLASDILSAINGGAS